MIYRFKPFLFAAFLSFFFMMSLSAEVTFDDNPSYKIEKVTPSEEKKDCVVSVRTNVSGASVYIDSSYKGIAPLSKKVSPGRHTMEIKKTHYTTRTFYFSISEGQTKDFYVDLEKCTGYIRIQNDWPDAAVRIDSSSAYSGTNEVDEGSHTVTVKKFGYETFSTTVYVSRNMTSDVKVNLSKAEFSCTRIEPSRIRFNPRNKGRLGQVQISFSVTSPQTGVLEIVDSQGKVYASKTYSFNTWDYSFEWDGTDADGWICFDGDYTARLTVGEKTYSCGFMIDSSITYPLTVLTPSGTGLGNLPLPLAYPKGTFIFSAGLGADFKPSESNSFYGAPFSAGLCWALNEHVEISGAFHSLIKSDSILSGTGAVKLISSAELSPSSSVNFGLNFRIGSSDDAAFEPYGIDTINGGAVGAMLGFTFDDTYFGANVQYTYNPVEGLQEKGDAANLKAGLSILRKINEFGVGAYASIQNSMGTYRYKKDEVSYEVDLNQRLRAFDAGLSVTTFVFSSSAQLSFNAGLFSYPDENENYIYTKVVFSYLF